MKTSSTAGKRAKAVQSVEESEPERRQAAALASAADLSEALAEARENILMVEQALAPARKTEKEPSFPYREFFRACAKGEEAEVRRLLTSGLNISVASAQGLTGLHVAAQNGHEPVVRLLLDKGADVDPRFHTYTGEFQAELVGATPFILAKASRRDSIAALLLSRGADPNATTDAGHTGQTIFRILSQLAPGLKSLNITID